MYAFIAENAAFFDIVVMCRVLGVGRSGYYAWRGRPESVRSREDRRLVTNIKVIHGTSKRAYGSRRIHGELRNRGFQCGHNRVARLMREHGIRAKQARKFRPTTNSNHSLPVAPNLLDRDFTASTPNQKWVADITYVPTQEGWLYLGAVVDLKSRLVVGHSMQERMTSSLVIDALQMALRRRRPPPGLLLHSDRGSQYASGAYQDLLIRHHVVCSMSRRGNCYDNAPMESFFATLKKELVHHQTYTSRAEARREILDYIESFYNSRRLHSSLGYLSPAAYELTMSA